MKKLLLVYPKRTEEVLNRQSALGSYIFCLCEILSKLQLAVFINGIPFTFLKAQAKENQNNVISSNKSLIKKIIPRFIKGILRDRKTFQHINELYQNVSKEKYDSILEFYNYASDVGYRLSQVQKIPLFVVYDAPVLEEYIFFNGNSYVFNNKILKRQLQTLLQASHIVCYSNPVKMYINKLCLKQLPVSIHQNVDFTRFVFLDKQFDQEEIGIGFIGSFLKWHRVDLLLQAFYRLKKKGYKAHLYLVGNGMELEAIKKSVEQSAYSKNVTLTGFLDGIELTAVKNKIQIGVMPGSNWYGAPNKIFEYAAAQMAVVAPDTPTISDLFLDQKELLLFKQDDVNQLYEKLKILCDDCGLTAQLALTIQQKIKETYSIENTSQFYKHLLRKKDD